MISETRREQHFAKTEKGVLTGIKEAHNSTEDFFCLSCGCRMQKKCGKIREWHFAHNHWDQIELQKNCTYESYLHSYAKYRLKKWFDESDSIILKLIHQDTCHAFNNCSLKDISKTNCVSKDKEIKSYNLKDFFNRCEMEKTITLENGETYRPDLLWYNDNKKENRVFIEIKVTHECSNKKKASSAMIIEFEVHSEEDVERIISKDIVEDESTGLYGFNTFTPKNEENKNPLYKVWKFILYNSDKAYPNTTDYTCFNYHDRKKSALFELSILPINDYEKIFFGCGLAGAKENGIDVKNCYLCEHTKYDKDNNYKICTINNQEIKNSCDGSCCANYKFDNNLYMKYSEIFTELRNTTFCDIWTKYNNQK